MVNLEERAKTTFSELENNFQHFPIAPFTFAFLFKNVALEI
jgi:hypothetical protein